MVQEVLGASGDVERIHHRWPGREEQIDTLLALLREPELSIPILVHGPSGSGKSAVIRDVLAHLNLPAALANCIACCSPRLLYENILNQLHAHQPSAANSYSGWSPCESGAAFVAGVQEAVAERGRACIVLEHAAELVQHSDLLSLLLSLPILCDESRVQLIFVEEAPWADFYYQTGFVDVANVRFAGYTEKQLVSVLLRHRQASVNEDVDTSYAKAFAAFVPLFVKHFFELCKDVHELQHLCPQVFDQWMQPVRDGLIAPNETSKLLYHARSPSGCLSNGLQKVYARDGLSSLDGGRAGNGHGAAALRLPTGTKYLLIAAYLASRFAKRHDVALFSATRRSGTSKRAKRSIAHTEDPVSFTHERLLWIYSSIRPDESTRDSSEVLVQLNSLFRQRLLTRISRADELDSIRLRCSTSRETIEAAARDVEFDLTPYFSTA